MRTYSPTEIWEKRMPRLTVNDKVGLGQLILSAATDHDLQQKLMSDPMGFLEPFLSHIPKGHSIQVVKEDSNLTYVVIPAEDALPRNTEEKERILRAEAQEYDEAKERVEESKKSQGGEENGIPPEVVEETFALMVGHSALSPCSRPQSRGPGSGHKATFQTSSTGHTVQHRRAIRRYMR
jgi:hypothetical protein